MPGKQTSWFDDMLMATSRRSNDLVAAAADLADKYGITPANAAAWIAKNIERRSPQEVERIRRNLQPLGSNRAIVEAGVRSNEDRFRQQGGRGARKPDDVQMPVRLSAAGYKPAAIPAAVAKKAPVAARAIANYFRENTPSAIASDAANLAKSGYNAFVNDPYGSIVENGVYMNPVTTAIAAPFDYARMRESSQMLEPYAKDDAEAASARDMVDALSVLPGLAVVPGLGAATRKSRQAVNTAARTARLSARPTQEAPVVVNRLYNEALLGPEYKPGDVLPRYGYRNVSRPSEIEALLREGYMLPPEGKTNKYFTMSDREEPSEGNRGAKPVLRVRSDKIPEGRAVSINDVEMWDNDTGTWTPVRKARGGLAVKKGRC